MVQRQENIRSKRRNEGSTRSIVYTVCFIILLACVILDIVFVKGIIP